MPWLIVVPLIALPIVEIALFIKSAQWVGIGMTIVLAIGAGVVGVALALLLPPVRGALRLWLGRHLHPVGPPAQQPSAPPVIETDYRVIRDDDDRDKHD